MLLLGVDLCRAKLLREVGVWTGELAPSTGLEICNGLNGCQGFHNGLLVNKGILSEELESLNDESCAKKKT